MKFILAAAALALVSTLHADVGVGVRSAVGAEIILDGHRTADIVTKKEYRDFRLHVEFLVSKEGGNDLGKGITDSPGGIKLQCEGHDVRLRNIWIKELDLTDRSTDFAAAD
jgi:hypothetical protein